MNLLFSNMQTKTRYTKEQLYCCWKRDHWFYGRIILAAYFIYLKNVLFHNHLSNDLAPDHPYNAKFISIIIIIIIIIVVVITLLILLLPILLISSSCCVFVCVAYSYPKLSYKTINFPDSCCCIFGVLVSFFSLNTILHSKNIYYFCHVSHFEITNSNTKMYTLYDYERIFLTCNIITYFTAYF
jgi:hypothetical protein